MSIEVNKLMEELGFSDEISDSIAKEIDKHIVKDLFKMGGITRNTNSKIELCLKELIEGDLELAMLSRDMRGAIEAMFYIEEAMIVDIIRKHCS